ncbi:hypothetical protein [Hathewaya massiliensis]|uniref:hypothetical protein n=1 Tax=Hathewaya massiliensis TaxID=1964382 RepID=UPI0011585585|nr:hypothetical protein [Hathewaya massiliensis]
MKVKRIVQAIFILIVIGLSVFFITTFSKKELSIQEIKDPSNTEYIKKEKNKEFFDIKCNYKIEKNQNELKESVIKYDFHIINKTNHSVNMGVGMHIPQILCDKGIISSEESRTALFLEEDKPVTTGNMVVMNYSSLAKDYESLIEEEKKIFNEFKDTLYLELYIDGNIFYVETSSKGDKLISEEEFIKKAGPFSKGRLKDELKKVYRLKDK